MIGLFYLLPVALYIFLAIVIFGSLRERSGSAARIAAVVAIGIPAWLMWGYRFADNYREFHDACDNDTTPKIVNPIPTEIPYMRSCSDARRTLAGSDYLAIECEQGYQTVRLTFDAGAEGLSPDGSEVIKCKAPIGYGSNFDRCFESQVVDEIATPYVESRDDLINRGSPFTTGILRGTETSISLPDETLVAYQRRFYYLPYGDRRLLGGSSGMAPRIQCKGRMTHLRLTEMFPPRL